MSLAAIVKALAAAGATAEQISAAVCAAEEGRLREEAEKVAERRAKDAERQRRHRLSRDVTVTVCDERDIPSDKEGPRTPKEITSPEETPSLRSVVPTSEKSTKRASRLPADWGLPAEWRDWTISEGMQLAEIDRQAARFRDFWIAKGGKDAAKTDWLATWRNWIRRALDDRPLLRAGPSAADRDAMAPVACDSPAFRPLLLRYRHEHGGADPPTNGKTASFPAAWVQASNEALRRMQQ